MEIVLLGLYAKMLMDKCLCKYLRVSLFLLSAFWLSLSANAKTITKDQASEIATDFLQKKTITAHLKGMSATVSLKSVEQQQPAAISGEASQTSNYYIFNNSNGLGFVIVAGDDEMKPIIGYSLIGSFDFVDMPVQLESYLEEYQAGIAAFKAGYAVAGRSDGGEAVEPLLSTKWDQDSPYNDLCKSEYSSSNFYTGCVATAIAQVMKYHNFPPNGHGVTNSIWNNGAIDLSRSIYDWDNMIDEYISGNWSESEGAAVARLMRDIGGAVEMSYGTNASSAFSTYIAPSMYKYFNYSKDIRHMMRESYDTQEWIDIIRENLQRGEPVIYGGTGAQGGHQFVCDGIDENDYVHINWGWSGMCDGYFDINALAPSAVGSGGGDGKFYKDHDMVVNIRPGDPDADNSDYEIPLETWNLKASDYTKLDSDGRVLSGQPMEFYLSHMVSNNTRARILGSGTLTWMVALYDKDKKLINEEFTKKREQYQHNRDTYWENDILLDFSEVGNGDYYVSLWYKDDRFSENNRKFDFASDPYLQVTVKDGAIYLRSQVDTADPIEILSVEQPGMIYSDLQNGILNVTVRNNSKSQIGVEPVFIYCVPETEAVDNPDLSALSKCGNFYPNSIYAGATSTYRATISCRDSNLEEGRYRLYFAFRDKLIATSEKYYVEVSAMPSDCPFILVDRISPDMKSYQNTDHEWMILKLSYISLKDWAWWFDNSVDFRVWAQLTDGSEDEFMLYEVREEWLSSKTESTNSKEIAGNPALLWKKPGEYKIWISYKLSKDEEWTEIDDPNNSAVFTLIDEIPFGPSVDMVGPMVINGGRNVVIGSDFEVNLRIKSPTGINIDAEHSFPRITSDPQSWESIGLLRSCEFSETELAADDEADVNIRFFMPDVDEYCCNRYMVLVSVYYEEYYCVLPRPGEYKESLYFTVDRPSGISDEIYSPSYRCNVAGHTVIVDGVGEGETVEIWSADGVKVAQEQTDGSKCEITLQSCAKGIYIVSVKSDRKHYRPTKIIVG